MTKTKTLCHWLIANRSGGTFKNANITLPAMTRQQISLALSGLENMGVIEREGRATVYRLNLAKAESFVSVKVKKPNEHITVESRHVPHPCSDLMNAYLMGTNTKVLRLHPQLGL